MQAIKQAIKKAMIEIADNQTNNQKVEDKKVEPEVEPEEDYLTFMLREKNERLKYDGLEATFCRHCHDYCEKILGSDDDYCGGCEDQEEQEEIEEWDCHCGICGEENNNQCSGGCNPNKGRTCVCSDCGDKPDEEEED